MNTLGISVQKHLAPYCTALPVRTRATRELTVDILLVNA